jgi:uncharacterized protein (TIGR02246 family)
MEATLAHDLDTIVATFAEDGVELSPGVPPVIGRDAYRDHCRQMLEQAGDFGFSFDQAELVVNTDWAFEWGTYSMTVQGETVDTGKYVWIYKKEANGEWRFGRVIYNSGT